VSDTRFGFVFLADTQLGCYATFSGFDQAQVEEYAAMGMIVEPVPRVEGFEWDARQYRRAVELINHHRPAFVVIGGDLIDDANSEDQTDEFLAITARIDGEIPVRWVPGNHDIAYDAVTPTRESIDAYRAVFGDDYYSFRHHHTLFIAMNTTVIDHPEDVPGEWDSQFGFLQDELESAGRIGVDHVVLLGHHPLFLKRADEPDTYWNIPAERRSLLLELIHRAGVRIGFAGHWHRNSIGVDGDFVQVTSGPVGYPLGVDPSGYRMVSVGRERVDHHYRALDDA
jgi:3',5'-cyclic AMP phosphodiesterase CpdA